MHGALHSCVPTCHMPPCPCMAHMQALPARPMTSPSGPGSPAVPPWRREQHAAAQRRAKVSRENAQQHASTSRPATAPCADRPSSRGKDEPRPRIYPGTQPAQIPLLPPNDLRRVVDDHAGVTRSVHSVFAPHALPRTPGAVRPGSQRGPLWVHFVFWILISCML